MDQERDEFNGVPEPPRPERRARPGVQPLTLAAVAVAGGTIGVAAVLIANAGTGLVATAGDTPSTAPATQAPAQGGGQQALPPLNGSGNGNGLQVMLAGRVVAVSPTSITLGGNGPSVTAKITQATQFSGKVHAISGVKVGDQVSAALTGTSMTSLTAKTIQDPGAAP